MTLNLDGLIPATVLPMSAGGEIAEQALRGSIRWVSPPGRALVAGIAGPFTSQAVAQARDYKAAGASALLVFPISAYLSSPLDPAIPLEYPRPLPPAGPRPAPARPGRTHLRPRPAAPADPPRGGGGEEGSVFRRAPLPRHVPH